MPRDEWHSAAIPRYPSRVTDYFLVVCHRQKASAASCTYIFQRTFDVFLCEFQQRSAASSSLWTSIV